MSYPPPVGAPPFQGPISFLPRSFFFSNIWIWSTLFYLCVIWLNLVGFLSKSFDRCDLCRCCRLSARRVREGCVSAAWVPSGGIPGSGVPSARGLPSSPVPAASAPEEWAFVSWRMVRNSLHTHFFFVIFCCCGCLGLSDLEMVWSFWKLFLLFGIMKWCDC